MLTCKEKNQNQGIAHDGKTTTQQHHLHRRLSAAMEKEKGQLMCKLEKNKNKTKTTNKNIAKRINLAREIIIKQSFQSYDNWSLN